MNHIEVAEAMCRALDHEANTARQNNQPELEIEAGEMQQAIGPLANGRIRRLCDLMQDDSLLQKVGVEIMGPQPDAYLATSFVTRFHDSRGRADLQGHLFSRRAYEE
jgi:hypothetical protein